MKSQKALKTRAVVKTALVESKSTPSPLGLGLNFVSMPPVWVLNQTGLTNNYKSGLGLDQGGLDYSPAKN